MKDGKPEIERVMQRMAGYFVVPVYATGEENGTHFYAMELIDGPSLDHVIRQMKSSEGRPHPDLTSHQGAVASRSPKLVATGPYAWCGNAGRRSQ
jgi:hypothetical protein